MGEQRGKVIVLLKLTRIGRYSGKLEILLQKRARKDCFDGVWAPAIVRRFTEYDSTPEKALEKIAKKELGISVKSCGLKLEETFTLPDGEGNDVYFMIYNLIKQPLTEPMIMKTEPDRHTEEPSAKPVNAKPNERVELRWVTLEDAMELLWRQSPKQARILKNAVRGKLYLDMVTVLKKYLELHEE